MRNNILAASVMAVLVLCGSAWADVSITPENFHDETFREYISSNFDSDSNGILSDAEIAEVKELPAGMFYINNTIASYWIANITVPSFSPSQPNVLSTVHDFTGIEHFTSLEALYYDELFKYGQQNLLSSVDLSHNTALKYLHFCAANLEELDLSANTALLLVECPDSGISSIDVSGCTSLEYLDCSSNSLTSLDLSANSALRYLDCSKNSLSELDTSGMTSLVGIYCSSNHLARLDLDEKALWVGDCASQSITGSYVTANGNDYVFDIKNFVPADELARVVSVDAYDSAGGEITITADGVGGLYRVASVPSRIVYLYDTDPDENTAGNDSSFDLPILQPTDVPPLCHFIMDVTISSINVREANAIQITTQSLPSGKVYKFYSADITASGTPPISWDIQGLPSALSYDKNASGLSVTVSGIPQTAGTFSVDVSASDSSGTDTKTFRLVITSRDGIPLSEFGDKPNPLESYDTKPKDDWLDPEEINDVTDLPPGLGYEYPPLRNRRPSVGVSWPIGRGGGGLGRFRNLRRLWISGGWGGSSWPGKGDGSGGTPGGGGLDLSGNTELEVLIIENVHLGTIDLSKNTKLRILILINCGLTALDLSKNTALEYLDCSYNYLRILDLSVNISLKYVYMHHNYLPHVNLQPNTAIITAECHSQDLTGELKDSGNTTNPYEFDLRNLPIPDANIGNVVQDTIRAYDSSDRTVKVTWNNGVLRFPKVAARVIYYYRTGITNILLEVIIRLSYTPPSNPPKPSVTLEITTSSLTSGTAGRSYTAPVSASGGTQPFTWSLSGAPSWLSIDPNTGRITAANPVQGNYTITVIVTDAAGRPASKQFTLTISPVSYSGTLTIITPEILPAGTQGEPYSQQLEARGSTPHKWYRLSGNLPDGLTLKEDGTISGTPSVARKFTFTVIVQNNKDPEAKRTFTLEIGPGSGGDDGSGGGGGGTGTGTDSKDVGNGGIKPDITAIYTLTNGYIGVWYSATLVASGTRAISWSIIDGRLPAGLTLNPDGTITGTPTAVGEYPFTVEAVNPWGKDVAAFRITIYTDESQCCNNDDTYNVIYEYTRNISSLTEYELGMLPGDIYIIAYVLPRFRVARAGTYSFMVNLYNTVPSGLTLVWFPFAVSGSGGGTAHFWDYRGGQEITVSPDNRRLIVSVYLDVGTYAPVIAVLRPSEPESEDTRVQAGGSGGGGGCSAVSGMGMLMLGVLGAVLSFRKR